MVHHFCFMRPIRSLFGFLLLAGAVVCFYRALGSSRFDWFMERAERQSFYPASVTTTVLKPVEKPDKLANPPQPSGDGVSARPSWVGLPPHVDPQDGVYVATATAGPYSTLEECDRALPGEIDRVVTDYAEKEFQPAVDQPVKLDREVIEDHLIKDRYRETVDSRSVGPMQEEHVLLEFGGQVRAEIAEQWRSLVVFQRLLYTARVAGTCFLALGGVYLLLRWKPTAAARS